MKTSIWLPASSAMVLILSGCTDQTDPNTPGTGPYDAAGNYHEEWADDPSKWRKPGRVTAPPSDDLPMIASNDQPPPDSNPLAPTTHKTSTPQADSMPRATKSKTTEPVEVASRSKTSSSSVKSKPKASTSSSKPKSTASKTRPKSKSTRYTVKKGDSLSTIAARNGSSVSAIQRANGIKGTLIRPGQSLVVPKR